MRYGTNQIVDEYVAKICANELKADDRLLSEHQLSIKYGVSRIVATRVYQKLKKLGAVYSIQRQGYFVAPYFSGVTTSPMDEYRQISRFEDKIMLIPFTPFMEKEKWSDNYISFERKYFKKDANNHEKLMIFSQNWINPHVDFQVNVTEITSDLGPVKIVSTITILHFEEFAAFNNKYNLVSYRVSYEQDSHKIVWISRSIVNPKDFKFIRQQDSNKL